MLLGKQITSRAGHFLCDGSAVSFAFPRLLTWFVACSLFFLMWSGAARCQNFQVGKISICYNKLSDKSSPCSEVGPSFVDLDRRKFSANRIYVSLIIVCGADAVAFLKANGFLPVNVGVWKDNVRKSNIPIGILQDDWDTNGTTFMDTFNDQGNFSWRTRFNVSLSGNQSIKLEIVDAQESVAYVGKEPARREISFAN